MNAPLSDRYILSMDTVQGGVGVCVCDGENCFSQRLETQRGQAEMLVPLAQQALDQAGIGFEQLNGLVVPLGPGSFTGLRIGLSAAKALAMALGIPLWGGQVLEVLAIQFLSTQDAMAVAVINETRRSDFYFQAFDKGGNALCDPASWERAQIVEFLAQDDFILIGDGIERFVEAYPDFSTQAQCGYGQLDPKFLARLAFVQPSLLSEQIEPIYLRGADVSQPKREPRKLKA